MVVKFKVTCLRLHGVNFMMKCATKVIDDAAPTCFWMDAANKCRKDAAEAQQQRPGCRVSLIACSMITIQLLDRHVVLLRSCWGSFKLDAPPVESGYWAIRCQSLLHFNSAVPLVACHDGRRLQLMHVPKMVALNCQRTFANFR
jgi:hypothetical protein